MLLAGWFAALSVGVAGCRLRPRPSTMGTGGPSEVAPRGLTRLRTYLSVPRGVALRGRAGSVGCKGGGPLRRVRVCRGQGNMPRDLRQADVLLRAPSGSRARSRGFVGSRGDTGAAGVRARAGARERS